MYTATPQLQPNIQEILWSNPDALQMRLICCVLFKRHKASFANRDILVDGKYSILRSDSWRDMPRLKNEGAFSFERRRFRIIVANNVFRSWRKRPNNRMFAAGL